MSRAWPVLGTPRKWKSKADAQEAHEAIRPTHVEVEDAGANSDEKALYALIRRNVLACQLEDAVFSVRAVKLKGEAVNGKDTHFEARGKTLLSPGWKVVLKADQSVEDEEEPDNPVPALKPGQTLLTSDGCLLTKQTKAAKRYTLASLVEALKQRGIGRPATYAAITDNITSRNYVKVEKKAVSPTPQGEAVIDALAGRFSFMEYQFTADMENTLDAIAEGKAAYLDLMQSAHARLDGELAAFVSATSSPCEKCGKPLIHRRKEGKGGYDFWGCSGYPECAASYENVNGKPGKFIEKTDKPKPELSSFVCGDCGKPLVRRQGKHRDGKGEYDLYGCSGFPKCKTGYPVTADGSPDFEKKFGEKK